MYSKKDRSNPDFLQDVLTQSFGEKRSSSQLLKLFEQKEREKLRAYSHSLNELLKNATKADPKAVSGLEKTLRDQFEDNVRDPFLRKELKRFIRECNPSFLDLREGALCQSDEEERPQQIMPRPLLSQEISVATPESSQCHASSTTTPTDKVLDVLLKQQQSLEELTSSVREFKQPRTQHSAKEWSRQGSNTVCFKCNKNEHIARNCEAKNNPAVRRGPPQGKGHPDKSLN